jgi:type IV pilus assembly protein PilN
MQIVFLLGALVAAGLILVLHYWSLGRDIQAINRNIAIQQREKDRLATLKQQVEAFEVQKRVLQQRIDVIETLRRNQAGPVQLLDALGATVNRTELLWLTQLKQSGNQLTINGMAGSNHAVANFITNLKRSGFFQNVEIKESKQDERRPNVTAFVFSVTCEFVPPQPAGAAPTKG